MILQALVNIPSKFDQTERQVVSLVDGEFCLKDGHVAVRTETT